MTDTDPFIHERAICESPNVGPGTRVWAFAHILPGARIGANCNVCDGVFIENDVVVGDNVTIKCGVQLWDGLRIGTGVFVGPNATFTNDRFPRSKAYPDRFALTVVEEGASIGANATILPGVRIGQGAMVGAGAVVTSDVPAHAVVVGNPARVVNFQAEQPVAAEALPEGGQGIVALGAGGSELWALRRHADPRGALVPIEFEQHLPFVPRRAFMVTAAGAQAVRGQHAHRACKQFLIAASGSLSCVVDDGLGRVEVRLDHPGQGLYLPAMVWGTQYQFSEDAVLLVLASDPYDEADYIRDYVDFLQAVEGGRA